MLYRSGLVIANTKKRNKFKALPPYSKDNKKAMGSWKLSRIPELFDNHLKLYIP